MVGVVEAEAVVEAAATVAAVGAVVAATATMGVAASPAGAAVGTTVTTAASASWTFPTTISRGPITTRRDIYYAPRRYYGTRYGRSIAYCHARFRSYNVHTRTYLGYDGRRHHCGPR